MCGIGGIMTSKSSFDSEQAEACVRLMDSLTRRGKDAWGYFDGRDVYKRPGDFSTSEEKMTLAQTLLNSGTNMFLCHTRKATQGDPANNENNHPFTLNPFIFAHNGLIKEADGFEEDSGIETDSYWLLYWIHQEFKKSKKVIEAIDRGVDHIDGIYACWMYNALDGFTYLFRIGNPIMEIQCATTEDQDLFVFGSDGDSIADALGRKFLKQSGWDKKITVKALVPGIVYKAKDGGIWKAGQFTPNAASGEAMGLFQYYFSNLMMYHQ